MTSNSCVNSPICPKNLTRPRFYGCPLYLQVWWSANQKWNCYLVDIFLSLWGPQGQVTLVPIVKSGPKLKLSVLLISKFDEDSIKNEVAIVQTTFFPIVCLWDLLVAMETEVLIRSAPKPNTANPPPKWWYLWNWPPGLGDILVWKCVDCIGCMDRHKDGSQSVAQVS